MTLPEIGMNCCSEHVDGIDKCNPITYISLLCSFRSFDVVVNENQNEPQGESIFAQGEEFPAICTQCLSNDSHQLAIVSEARSFACNP